MDYIRDKYPTLLALLEKRFELAERYLLLTEKQDAAIIADDEAALLSALDERGALSGEVDDVNRDTDSALREYRKSSYTAKAEELLERTRALYVKCLALDRKNMALIKAQMSKATGESKEFQKRREGINKYAQSDYIFTPSVLDEHQ